MPFIQVKCTSCGGEIQLDREKESGYCLHCGTKVILQEAIQKLEVTNLSSSKNLFTLAERAYSNSNYDEAIKYSTKVLELNAHDYEAILLKGFALGMKSTPKQDFINDVITSVKIAQKECFAQDPEKVNSDEFIQTIAIEIKKIITFIKGFWPESDYGKFHDFLYYHDSHDLFIKRFLKCIELCEFCVTLLENKPSLHPILAEYYLLILHFLVDLCKQYKDFFEKQKFVIHDENTRKPLIEKYDKNVNLLLKIKPDSEVPSINRKDFYCYIATYIYSSYEAPEVIILRRFRDRILDQNSFGRLFINIYYILSPWFIKLFLGKPKINHYVKIQLDKFTKFVQDKFNL